MTETTPPPHSRRPDSDEIVLTDRDLVSRYIRYSENLDEELCSPEKTRAEPTFSSPASDISNHDGDTSHISAVSHSTAHTTPLRNDLLDMARCRILPTPFEEFEAVLHDAEMPITVINDYRQRSRDIMQISSLLFARDRDRRLLRMGNKELIRDLMIATGDWFAAAVNEVETQVQNTAYLQTLGPFTVSPGPDDMWPIYKQMVKLVLEHTRSPSQGLVNVVESLAYLWDAYVYQPALVDQGVASIDNEIELQLHSLYDAIMSLLMKNQEWCRSTKALIRNHLRPALERILSTPAAVQSINDDEATRKAANEVLTDPGNPGYLPVSAEVLKVLREKRSTQLLQIRAKRRFARVYTV